MTDLKNLTRTNIQCPKCSEEQLEKVNWISKRKPKQLNKYRRKKYGKI